MTSTAIKAPIEVICISDDEIDDCLIISPNSHPVTGIEATRSDNNKGHHHGLQGIIEQKNVVSTKEMLLSNVIDILNFSLAEVVPEIDLTNEVSDKRAEISSDVIENSCEMSSLSKYPSPAKSFDVYISSIDGKSQLFDIVSSEALVPTDSNKGGSQPNSSSKIASSQGINRNHQSDFESSAEDLEKENNQTPGSTNSSRKVVSEEECDTCSPPFHTCKRFGNVTDNFNPNWKNVKQYKATVVKPIEIYRCKVCLKAFTQKWILVRHQLIHEDPITWNSCPFCTYKTPYRTSMKLHLKNHKARRTTINTNILKTERRDLKMEKAKRSSFWQCVYCRKKFQLAEYCERHELHCRDGDRIKLSKVFTDRLRKGVRESMPNK